MLNSDTKKIEADLRPALAVTRFYYAFHQGAQKGSAVNLGKAAVRTALRAKPLCQP